MSLKTNTEILSGFTLLPAHLTFANYHTIFTDPCWYMGYINSIIYVVMNTVISVAVALPAAYAFSRYRFLGDKHLFFWLLTNRMAPPAVFAAAVLPALLGVRPLRHPHRRGARALPVQRPARGVDPRGLHVAACRRRSTRPPTSTATRFPRFFVKIFMPLIASGIGVAAFFCFMFSLGRAAARPHADLGRRQADRRDDDPHRLGRRAWTGACSPPPAC